MKLHINKIHDTHSVRSQLLRIFLLAGMFPLLVIGIFSIASVRKQMLARYESLEKADGLRVASSLNDITTTVYSSSDTLLNSNQCLSLFAAESLDSGIEEHAQSIERSHKMLKLVESSVELLRNKHKHGEDYYWLLYYSFLSPQQYRSAEEIIEQLKPHIRDISYRTYFRKRKEAIEALSSVLWGYTSRDSLNLLENFFPENEKGV